MPSADASVVATVTGAPVLVLEKYGDNLMNYSGAMGILQPESASSMPSRVAQVLAEWWPHRRRQNRGAKPSGLDVSR
jgi:hypothetical protein